MNMLKYSDEPEALIASIERTPIATAITNPRLPDNPIIAVNEAFELLTGYARDEVVGRNCRFLAGENRDQPGSALLRDAVASGQPAFAELLNFRKDGSPFHNAVMIAPMLDCDGELLFFVGSQMDISTGTGTPAMARRRRAQEQIKGLTPRQREILQTMTEGCRNKQIADRLGISEKTVKMHRAAMLDRLEAPTSADAVRIAVEAGL